MYICMYIYIYTSIYIYIYTHLNIRTQGQGQGQVQEAVRAAEDKTICWFVSIGSISIMWPLYYVFNYGPCAEGGRSDLTSAEGRG